MSISIDALGQGLWVLGIVGWYVIRHPFERRARRMRVISDRRSRSDRIGLAVAFFGLGVVPALNVATGFPEAADYPAAGWAVGTGAIVFAGALWLFRSSHKELGRNWSITLEIREKHRLVSGGPYAFVRHPIYTSAFVMYGGTALASGELHALLGVAIIAIAYARKIPMEEKVLTAEFGPAWEDYRARTSALFPFRFQKR